MAHGDEEGVQSFEGSDLDVSIELGSSELKHAKRDKAEAPERRLVGLLADSEEDPQGRWRRKEEERRRL